MKRDKLEQFIIENREDFNNEEPSPGLWDKINKSEATVRKTNWKAWTLRAAAAILIFMVAWFSRDVFDKKTQEVANEENQMTPEQREQYRLLMEAELYYNSRISHARTQLTSLVGSDKTILEDMDTDLGELDQVFEDLKNDLKENGDNEEVIEAMIQNYRIKLEILEEMLRQMNDSGLKNEKNEEHEI
ncbi:MAG TPA: hypothetical protein P5514_09170 [Bacteroidales bacterium]|nr:hypothetical protein [Bacteroidales bacterium]HRX97100.1 hypothetical protein [Bacteroidales bacterium]